MDASKSADFFSNYQILAFEVRYVGSNLSNFETIRYVGKDLAIVFAYILLIEEYENTKMCSVCPV